METIIKKENILLGISQSGGIIFGELEVRKDKHGETMFSSSGFSVMPFCGNEFNIEGYWNDVIAKETKNWKYDMCEKYNCAPDQIAYNLACEEDDPREIVDCSLFPECVEVKGRDWYFYSGSAGQIDEVIGNCLLEECKDPKLYLDFLGLHKRYHLKEVPDDVIEQVRQFVQYCERLEEDNEQYIREYIRSHEKELENFP